MRSDELLPYITSAVEQVQRSLRPRRQWIGKTYLDLEMHSTKNKPEKLEDLISHILEEARMVLPGIQALLGFQLIAVFNQRFAEISPVDQYIHVAAVCLSINAICFLLTPAALHRQSLPEQVTIEFAETASRFVCMGMLPLLFSIVLDAYVVIQVVSNNGFVSIGLALILFFELVYCWIIMPQLKKRTSSHHVSTPAC